LRRIKATEPLSGSLQRNIVVRKNASQHPSRGRVFSEKKQPDQTIGTGSFKLKPKTGDKQSRLLVTAPQAVQTELSISKDSFAENPKHSSKQPRRPGEAITQVGKRSVLMGAVISRSATVEVESRLRNL
jgi:hypothetical protein